MPDISIEILCGQTTQHLSAIDQRHAMHPQALAAYQNMQAAAEKDGIDLALASSFRDFSRQLAIFAGKASGNIAVKDQANQIVPLYKLSDWQKLQAILLFSALPGTSRHHWGTDIDVYQPSALGQNQLQLEPWEYQKGGPFVQLSEWLGDNSKSFGFYLPYDQYRGGVAEEPWHLSYYPVSGQYQAQLTIERYIKVIQDQPLPLKKTIVDYIEEIFQRYVTNVGRFEH